MAKRYEEDDIDDVPNIQHSNPDSDLTPVDWVLCILCSGIGCIIGIIRLIQGKPSGGKMIGISLVFAVLWNILAFIVQNAGR
jgi:hypothetical protein